MWKIKVIAQAVETDLGQEIDHTDVGDVRDHPHDTETEVGNASVKETGTGIVRGIGIMQTVTERGRGNVTGQGAGKDQIGTVNEITETESTGNQRKRE